MSDSTKGGLGPFNYHSLHAERFQMLIPSLIEENLEIYMVSL